MLFYQTTNVVTTLVGFLKDITHITGFFLLSKAVKS